MKKPNVIILYADDLGYGDLGCYGAEDIKTPNIDALANDGLKFSNAYSTSPVCTPARFSLLTGQYPCRKKGIGILTGDDKLILDEDQCNLPQIFKRQGYQTAIVGKWHLGLGRGTRQNNWNLPIEGTPLDVGFDQCFIFPATADRVPCVFFDGRNVVHHDITDPIAVSYDRENPFPNIETMKSHTQRLFMESSRGHDMSVLNGVGRIGYMKGGKQSIWLDEELGESFLSKAKEFISRERNTPFFLYYPLHQPHVPRIPAPRFQGSTGLGPRGDSIAELDWCVGEIMHCLEENGLLENTLIIFSSDNGPILDDGYRDNAVERNGYHKPSGPFRGGKYSKYEGGIRIPFIVNWKGRVKQGDSTALISQVDLLASFAALLNENCNHYDSENVLDALLGDHHVGRSEVFAEGTLGGKVLREDKWLYIQPDQGVSFIQCGDTTVETGSSIEPMLFNLDYDIGQNNNLYHAYREQAEKMERKIQIILSKQNNL